MSALAAGRANEQSVAYPQQHHARAQIEAQQQHTFMDAAQESHWAVVILTPDAEAQPPLGAGIAIAGLHSGMGSWPTEPGGHHR